MKPISTICFCTHCLLFFSITGYCQKVIKHSERPNGHNSPYRIPINEILASPDVYEGTHIQVVGFINLALEDYCIYLSQDDLKSHRFKKGLWLHLDQSKIPSYRKYDHQYVAINAIFDVNDHGHEHLWGGALKKITWVRLFNP